MQATLEHMGYERGKLKHLCLDLMSNVRVLASSTLQMGRQPKQPSRNVQRRRRCDTAASHGSV